MDNISEAQTEVASIPPPSAIGNTRTSISQEPVFEQDGVEHHEVEEDEMNVSFRAIHLEESENNGRFSLLQGFAERKVGFKVETELDNTNELEDEPNYSENDEFDKKEPLKLHRR